MTQSGQAAQKSTSPILVTSKRPVLFAAHAEGGQPGQASCCCSTTSVVGSRRAAAAVPWGFHFWALATLPDDFLCTFSNGFGSALVSLRVAFFNGFVWDARCVWDALLEQFLEHFREGFWNHFRAGF